MKMSLKSLKKKKKKNQLILSIKGPSGVSLFTVSIKNKGFSSVNKSYSAVALNEVDNINTTCSMFVKRVKSVTATPSKTLLQCRD